jgi:hypothetical protein
VKLEFFKRTAPEQALIIRETAARRGLLPVMVEKDFWVSWTLAVLFAHPEFGKQLVFKGGTSLSKVFGVIERFSEDIDLSVSPSFLGISEESVEQAPGTPLLNAHWLGRICGNAWRIGRAGSSRQAGRVMIWPDPEHSASSRRNSD